MVSVLVPEEVVNAEFFHDPADEGQVGFSILNVVFNLVIIFRELLLESGKAVFAEDLLDDLRRRLVVEDPAVRHARQQPQPGTQHQAIAELGLARPGPLALDKDAIEMAGLIVTLDRHCTFRPQGSVEINVLRFAQGLDVEGKEFAQAF